MGAFAIVFIGALLITDLHFINTVPVAQLSVKLLCELLCEHCNGVANMESGHCNCEVPEAHFKDNSPCLERAQISAAEMNLKLTHFKNTYRERSVSDILGRTNLKAVEDAEINHSQGHNKIPGESLTPSTPNPFDVNKSNYPTPDHKELFVKRSINNGPDPGLKKENGYQEQSTEHKMCRKRSTNYFQRPSLDSFYLQKSMPSTPSSRIFSGSKLRSEKLSVIPRREKRSYTKPMQFARNEDGTIFPREVTNPNENYDVIVNVQADISIPALEAKQVDNENIMNLKSQVNQVSLPQAADDSNVMKSEKPNPKQNFADKIISKIISLVSVTPTDAPLSTTKGVVSNKSRSAVDKHILNTDKSDASKSTDLINESNSLQSNSDLPSLASLKLPKLVSRCNVVRSSNENKILQRSRLNELKSRIERLLFRGPPRIPLNEFLKGQRSSSAIAENNPLPKLMSVSLPRKCSTPLGKSKNTALGDLPMKGAVNDLKLKDQGIGLTLLEKIKNNQLKFQQNLLGGLSEQYRAQNRGPSKCQFKNQNPSLSLKFEPSVPIESKTDESTNDCEDEYNDDVASPMHSVDTFRSNPQQTESVPVDDEIKTDPPVIVPVSQESRISAFIPTQSNSHSVVTTALPSEPIAHVGEIGFTNETKHEENENKQIAKIPQSKSEPPKEKNISPTQYPVPDIRIMLNISDPKSVHKEPISAAVPANVASAAPVANLEAHARQSEDPSQNTRGSSMDEKKILSNHPHFVNHHETNNFLMNASNYLSSLFMPPAFGNNIRLSPMSPKKTHHGMFDPASFRNDMQRTYSPPLLARNDLSNTNQATVLNRPVVTDPNSMIPLDHSNRLPVNFNGAPDHPNLPLPNEQSGMIMRGFVQAESYPNNPANLPRSTVFILKPLRTPDGNIPYPELFNQIRTGNAVVQIYPIHLNKVDDNTM